MPGITKKQLDKVKTRDDFIAFIKNLLRNLQEHPEEWQNISLEDYLESVAAWVEDMSDIYYRNIGKPIPKKHLTWKYLAEVLYAGKIYE